MDPWLVDIAQRLGKARTRVEIEAILDELEDKYDAFSGPGEELVDQLLRAARERLARSGG